MFFYLLWLLKRSLAEAGCEEMGYMCEGGRRKGSFGARLPKWAESRAFWGPALRFGYGLEDGRLHDFDALGEGLFLLLGDFGQADGEDAVFDLGADLLLLHVLGQAEQLFELCLAELVAQHSA